MLGTFIDTLIICSMTGLVIIVTGAWQSGETGASLSSTAFETALPGVGSYIVSFGFVGAGGSGWRHGQPVVCVVARRYLERADGDSQPDCPVIAEPGGVQTDARILWSLMRQSTTSIALSYIFIAPTPLYSRPPAVHFGLHPFDSINPSAERLRSKHLTFFRLDRLDNPKTASCRLIQILENIPDVI